MAYKTHERSKVNYRYPENLKQGAQKSYISFETYVESPLTISGILSKTNENQRVRESKGGNEDDGQFDYSMQSAVNVAGNVAGGVVGKIFGIDNSSSEFAEMTVSGKFVDIEKSNGNLSGRRVELYMPISITFPDGATYENTDLGIVGAIGENTLQSGKSIASTFLDTVKGGLKTLAGGITGTADGAVGSVLVTELLRNKSGKFTKPLSDVAGLATRVTPDANSRVLFKGVAFREFSFQFKLIASSYEEAKQIEGLIRFLRSELYPDIIQSISSQKEDEPKSDVISLGQRYPNRFQIKMKYGEGRNNEVLNKIKPAYLRAVNTVYNGTQQSFHQSRNGGTAKPFEVDLTLTFQESLKLTRQDVVEGY
jgi:hypothetical protein